MRIEQEDIYFQGQTRYALAPSFVPTKFNVGVTKPNIRGSQLAICSGGVVTITNFLGGSDGQTLRLLGDGTTTLQHGTYIFNNTGADKLLAANKIYTYSYVDSLKKWFENA